MKNKLFLSLLAVGTIFAACSKDKELAPSGEGEVVATFAIATPGAFTKVAGDGQSVDKVVCAVYDAVGGEITALRATETVTAKKATFSTRLVKGQAYRVAFFAYNDAAAAYDVTDLKNITVKDQQLSNAEGRDAFTAFVDLSAADTEAPIAKDVHLYRPFAQLNIACSQADWDAAVAAGITVTSSSVSLSGQGIAFGAFNAYADEVVAGSEVATLDFAEAARLAEDLTVNGVAYKSIAMNYVLVGNKGEKNTADVTFAWKDAAGKTDGATFTAVPLQRNWRTNIVGDLLTNSAVFNIIVDEPFDGDLNPTWVSTRADLLAAVANGGHIVLNSDMTLDAAVMPAATSVNIPAGKEVGIDLGGHNLSFTKKGKVMFAVPAGASLSISNGTITPTNARAINAVSIADVYGTLVLDGVTVVDDRTSNASSNGIPVGINGNASVTIKNSEINARSNALATNANNPTQNVTVNLENSTFKGSTTIFINIPSNVTMKGCTVVGNTHGMVMRGGTALIEDSDISYKNQFFPTQSDIDNSYLPKWVTKYATADWGSGNSFPIAALVMGNKNETAWQYPTSVTLKNTKLNIDETDAAIAANFPTVLIHANQGTGLGVTFAYDNACVFDADSKGIVCESSNVTINGVAQ